MSKTRTELTSAIMTQNVLSFTLVQTQMEKNFKTIIEALNANDDDLTSLMKYQKETEKQMNGFQSQMERSNEKQETLEKQLSNLRLILEEMGKNTSSTEKIIKVENPENDKKDEEKVREAVEKMEKKQITYENNQKKIIQDLENIKKELNKSNIRFSQTDSKEEQNHGGNQNLKNLENQIKKIIGDNNKTKIKIQQLQQKVGDTEGIKVDLDEIKEKLQKFIEQEYNPTKETIFERLANLEKDVEQNKKGIDEQKRMRTKLSEEVWKMNDLVYEKERENMDKQLNLDLLKKMQNDMIEMKKRINGFEINPLTNKNSTNNSTTINKNTNETFTESPNKYNNNNYEGSTTSDESFRKQIIDKLNDQKHFFLKTYKKLQNTNQTETDKQKLNKLEEAIMRLDYLNNEKADIQTMKKLLGYLQNKITYVFNLINGNNNEEDACIARRNWACLSCQKKLDKYQGKIGSHLISGQLKSKALDQESVGGGMLLKGSKSKVDLPNVFKAQKKTKQ